MGILPINVYFNMKIIFFLLQNFQIKLSVPERYGREHIVQFHMSRGVNNQVSKIHVHLDQLLADDFAALGDKDRKCRSQALGCKETAENLSSKESDRDTTEHLS